MARLIRRLACLGCFFAAGSGSVAHAEPTALIFASDSAQIKALKVAKVMADDAPLWLSVRVGGPARLALVASDAALPSAPAADAWLRALDFTTRVRVAPPVGSPASCATNHGFALVDTGLPESAVIPVQRAETVTSELELRRALQDAGISADPARIARFSQGVQAPYRVSFYDAPAAGGETATLRLLERGNAAGAPELELADRDTVAISLIALATGSVLPPEAVSADPSQFAVTYRAAGEASPRSDYLTARSSWLTEQPTRWLLEAQNSSALFAWTVFQSAQLAPVVTRYFEGLASGGACAAQAQAAHAQGSSRAADYTCGDHDDLPEALAKASFGDLRSSRLYGLLGAAPVTFRIEPGDARSALVTATDGDAPDCAIAGGITAVVGSGMSSSPASPVTVSDPGADGSDVSDPGTPIYTDDGGCNLVVDSCNGDSSSDSSSSDSCSGDSSSDSSSSDSCSGDSSSSDSSDSSDSCSGDSKSDSSSDSCSGNSDSSSDSSGCGKSDGYDGDTCSGNAHSSAEALSSSSAELRSNGTPRHRKPRRVHLSLLTLLAAALCLPLRRLRSL